MFRIGLQAEQYQKLLRIEIILAPGPDPADNGRIRGIGTVKQIEPLEHIENLKDKLNRALRQLAGLKQKSKYLEMQYEDSRGREGNTNELIMELLERQRELNVMLNRANIMLNRTQEAMALSSMELNEMAKALPEPKKAEWADRVSRVNDLFKQTGVEDAETGALESGSVRPVDASFGKDEMKRESEAAFGKKSSIWDRKEQREPRQVQAEIVEEEEVPNPQQESIRLVADDAPTPEPVEVPACEAEDNGEPNEEDALLFPARRKSWWRKMA